MRQLSNLGVPLGGGAPWNPLQLPGLIRWHFPSRSGALWQDSARTTLATANNDPVGSLDDLSGNGRHLIQATSGKRMSLLLNYTSVYNAVISDNIDDALADATYSESATEIWYIVAAVKREGSAGVGQNVIATSARLNFEQGSNNRYEQYAGSTLNSGITLPVAYETKIIKTNWAGASSRVSVHNGTSWTDGTAGNPGSGVGTSQTIGIGGGQPKNTVRYLEIVFVSSITAANEANLVNYFKRIPLS